MVMMMMIWQMFLRVGAQGEECLCAEQTERRVRMEIETAGGKKVRKVQPCKSTARWITVLYINSPGSFRYLRAPSSSFACLTFLPSLIMATNHAYNYLLNAAAYQSAYRADLDTVLKEQSDHVFFRNRRHTSTTPPPTSSSQDNLLIALAPNNTAKNGRLRPKVNPGLRSKVQTKDGALSMFMDMPLDIIYEVCGLFARFTILFHPPRPCASAQAPSIIFFL